MADAQREQVRNCVARHSGLAIEKIAPESRLLHDLEIDGDDAADLLIDYSKAFTVDMTDFSFDQFFMGESHVFNFWKFWQRGEDHLLPLTVEDLYQSALQKKFVYDKR